MKSKSLKKVIASIVLVGLLINLLTSIPFTVGAVSSRNANTQTELRDAITASTDGDTINIKNNIVVTSAVAILNKSIIINGNSHSISVSTTGLSEAGTYNAAPSAFRVFTISGIGKTVEINDLTIKGGKINPLLNNGGGAIRNTNSTLKLTGVTISNSQAGDSTGNNGRGGGLYNVAGTVYLKDSSISRNAASFGGGFENEGTMFIENSTCSENRSLSPNGGGGAGENTGNMYVNNSTFSNNKSTELGGAIKTSSGTSYIANSTFTGNVTFSALKGGALANYRGSVTTINSLFAYNYYSTNSGISYVINDFEGDRDTTDNINVINSIFQQELDETNFYPGKVFWTETIIDDEPILVPTIVDGTASTRYTGLANGSDNTLVTGGISTKVLAADGSEIGSASIFQPYLCKRNANSKTLTALLKNGSLSYGNGTRTGFINGNGTPTIGFYNGTSSSWTTLVGSNAQSYEVLEDQNYDGQLTPRSVGAVITYADNLYMLKVNAAVGGTVLGGTIYGDVYPSGTNVTLTAVADTGKKFSHWDYVEGGTGTASTDNPYTVLVNKIITLVPVYDDYIGYTVSYSGNGNTSGSVPTAQDFYTGESIVTSSEGTLVKSGYVFTGWNTRADGEGTNYAVGATYSSNANLVLYAKWADVTAPTITGVSQSAWSKTSVTVTATTADVASGVNTQKWLSGTKTADDFGAAGTVYTGASFNVTANGIYTLYAIDNAGNETVSTFTVTHIDATAPTITNIAQSEQSMTSVTVYATIVDTQSGIGTQKWLSGTKVAADFVTGGTTLVGDNFVVTENGVYTIYASDNVGNVTVSTYTVTNFIEAVHVISVSLDKTSISLFANETSTLTPTINPSDATDKSVSWHSSNTNIATVDNSGVVTAVATGNAVITVTTTDGGKTATCNVEVKKQETKVVITDDDKIKINIYGWNSTYKYQIWNYQTITSDIFLNATSNVKADQWVLANGYTLGSAATLESDGSISFTIDMPAQTPNGNYVIAIKILDENNNYIGQLKDVYTPEQIGVVMISKILVDGERSEDNAVREIKAGASVAFEIKSINANAYSATVNGQNTFEISSNNNFTWDISSLPEGNYTVVFKAENTDTGSSYSNTIVFQLYSKNDTVNYGIINSMTATGLMQDNKFKLNLQPQIVNGDNFYYQVGEPNRAPIISSNMLAIGSSYEKIFDTKMYGIYNVLAYVKRAASNTYDDGIVKTITNQRGGTISMDFFADEVNINSLKEISGAKDTSVIFTASANIAGLAQGNIQYSYWRYDAKGFVLVKDWSSSNSLSWTPARAGVYTIQVRAKGTEAGSYEVAKSIVVNVSISEIAQNVSISINEAYLNANATARTPIVISANAVSATGESLLYKFNVGDSNLGVATIQDYSPTESVRWVPRKAGTYTINVLVKNSESFGKYDAIGEFTITVQ